MKVLFLSNIPSPYRIDFFNKLGEYIDLKVIFEAERAENLNNNWFDGKINTFESVFLKKGNIREKKIDWKIIKYLKKKNQDIVVVTNYSYYTELLGLMIIKLKKIPYIMELDGSVVKKESIIKYLIKKLIINGAIAYISPSKSTDDYLKYYGVEEKKIFRYPFTSINSKDILKKKLEDNKKQKLRSELGISGEKVIISVGRLIDLKGFESLIKAWKYIDKRYKLIIAGDGENREKYKHMIEKMGIRNIEFIGFKSKRELIDYYRASDLFILLTKGDVWGLVINEAMSNGLPIITTDKCGAGLELIRDGENGYLVPVDNEKILLEKIDKILSNNELINIMSKNNIEKINDYSIEKMVTAHLEIFEKLKGV